MYSDNKYQVIRDGRPATITNLSHWMFLFVVSFFFCQDGGYNLEGIVASKGYSNLVGVGEEEREESRGLVTLLFLILCCLLSSSIPFTQYARCR